MKNILEKLAEIEHEQWMEWSKTVAKTENISKDRLDRWKSCWIPYSELSEEMKEFDRVYARKIIAELSLKESVIKEDDVPVNNVSSGEIAGTTSDTLFRPSGYLGKTPMVRLPQSDFMKMRLGKVKHKRWNKFIENSGLAANVKNYLNSNPKQSLLAQCENTGAMCYIRKVD